MKKEVFKIPILNYAMRKAEFVSVDREGKEAGKQSIEKAVELIKQKKYSFLVFPEGTRSRTGDLQEFRRGGFFLAVDSRTSILPAVIKGSHELMPKHSFFVKKGNVAVTFLPAVPMDGFTRENMFELMDRIRTTISQELKEY